MHKLNYFLLQYQEFYHSLSYSVWHHSDARKAVTNCQASSLKGAVLEPNVLVSNITLGYFTKLDLGQRYPHPGVTCLHRDQKPECIVSEDVYETLCPHPYACP